MAGLEVWYTFIGHNKKPLPGNAFFVNVPHDAHIGHFTNKIKEERPDILKHVVPATLTVWKCTDPKLVSSMNAVTLKKALSNIDFTEEIGRAHV